MLQLRAAQLAQNTSQRRVHHVEHAKRDIRLGLGGKLVCKASCIVAFGQVLSVVDASSEVGHVDAGKGVGFAGISTNVKELGLERCQQMSPSCSRSLDVTYVESCSIQNVSKEVRDGVRVCERAFVLETMVSFGSRRRDLPVLFDLPSCRESSPDLGWPCTSLESQSCRTRKQLCCSSARHMELQPSGSP